MSPRSGLSHSNCLQSDKGVPFRWPLKRRAPRLYRGIPALASALRLLFASSQVFLAWFQNRNVIYLSNNGAHSGSKTWAIFSSFSPQEPLLSDYSPCSHVLCFFPVDMLLMKSLTAYGLRTSRSEEQSSSSGSKCPGLAPACLPV